MNDNQRKVVKILTLVVTVLIIVFIAYTVYLFLSRLGKVAISINVAPNDSQVVFTDGSKNYKSGNGVGYVPPGEYTIKISRQNFSSYTQKVTIKSGVTPKPLFVELSPSNAAGNTWMQNNSSQFNTIETKSEKYDNAHRVINKTAEIFSQLPYQNAYYTIGYQLQSNGQPEITIDTASPQYRYEAFQHIYQMGFNPADYHIVFTNYVNPLGVSSS